MEKPIYHFALARLHDPHAAAEVLTDTMLDIWRNAGRFEGRSKVSTWIFGIARYKVLNILKTRNKHAHEEMDPEMPDEDSPSVCEQLAATQDANTLQRCLDALPSIQREVVHLAFFEDMPYDDIAILTKAPVGTIKSRMYHARQALKSCLNRLQMNIGHTD